MLQRQPQHVAAARVLQRLGSNAAGLGAVPQTPLSSHRWEEWQGHQNTKQQQRQLPPPLLQHHIKKQKLVLMMEPMQLCSQCSEAYQGTGLARACCVCALAGAGVLLL